MTEIEQRLKGISWQLDLAIARAEKAESIIEQQQRTIDDFGNIRDEILASQLRSSLNSMRDEIEEAQDEIEDNENEIKRLRNQVDELRADRDEDRRRMAWQIYRDNANAADVWPGLDEAVLAFRAVDAFFAAEKEDVTSERLLSDIVAALFVEGDGGEHEVTGADILDRIRELKGQER